MYGAQVPWLVQMQREYPEDPGESAVAAAAPAAVAAADGPALSRLYVMWRSHYLAEATPVLPVMLPLPLQLSATVLWQWSLAARQSAYAIFPAALDMPVAVVPATPAATSAGAVVPASTHSLHFPNVLPWAPPGYSTAWNCP